MNNYRINFDTPKEFTKVNFRKLDGIVGLYFIFLSNTEISYPFKKSRLIYIGMSEQKTNSIGKRLIDHFSGASNNSGLTNYRKKEPLLFTYLNFESLKNIWDFSIEDLESYFIIDFVKKYGVYPICNNKTMYEVNNFVLKGNFEIDWKYFEV